MKFRCKCDYFLENFQGKNLVLDLKTTQSSEENSFYRDIANFKYYLQAYIYSKVMDADFKFIVVENKEPYMVASYDLGNGKEFVTQEWQEIAIKNIEKALNIVKHKDFYMQTYRIFGVNEDNSANFCKSLPLPPTWLLYQD